MSTTTTMACQVIKIEDSPEPMNLTLATPSRISNSTPMQSIDAKDPEGFLRRCSGFNKKKNVRCSATIGRSSHSSHPTFLPTCHAHKDQQSYAGWCQLMQKNGERCGRLFRWTPPYFELCADHQGHPNTPCYFLSLPLELRLEIFRYLLPTRPIGSSTSLLHVEEEDEAANWFCLYAPQSHSPSIQRQGVVRRSGQITPIERSTTRTVFPVPLMNMLLVNRQVCNEVKDLLYSTVPFTIDVRKDGTFMCGRRVLEPRRADGSSHFVANEVDMMKDKFLNTFDFSAVKNYSVDILVENMEDNKGRNWNPVPWSEEVELYDIRDYVGVVVSGILSKSRNLCKLNVRVGLSKFTWEAEEFLKNVKTIVGPFERLRNVRQARFRGVYDSDPTTNFMISLPIPGQMYTGGPVRFNVDQPPNRPATPLCSVPQLPAQNLIELCLDTLFSGYRSDWERCITSTSSRSLVHHLPIRTMFTQFKEFYSRLSAIIPGVVVRGGKHGFLHRARVAREQENIEGFRELRNELIGYWYAYLEQEDRKRDDMNKRLSRMLDVDVYPSMGEETRDPRRHSHASSSSKAGSSAQSPLVLDMDTMTKEGIPVETNVLNDQDKHIFHITRQQQAQHEMNQRHLQQQKRQKMRRQEQLVSAKQTTQPSSSSSSSSSATPSPVLHQTQCSQTMALNPPLPSTPTSVKPPQRSIQFQPVTLSLDQQRVSMDAQKQQSLQEQQHGMKQKQRDAFDRNHKYQHAVMQYEQREMPIDQVRERDTFDRNPKYRHAVMQYKQREMAINQAKESLLSQSMSVSVSESANQSPTTTATTTTATTTATAAAAAASNASSSQTFNLAEHPDFRPWGDTEVEGPSLEPQELPPYLDQPPRDASGYPLSPSTALPPSAEPSRKRPRIAKWSNNGDFDHELEVKRMRMDREVRGRMRTEEGGQVVAVEVDENGMVNHRVGVEWWDLEEEEWREEFETRERQREVNENGDEVMTFVETGDGDDVVSKEKGKGKGKAKEVVVEVIREDDDDKPRVMWIDQRWMGQGVCKT